MAPADTARTPAPSHQAAAGTVVRQSRAAGDHASANAAVDLVVSQGPPPAQAPPAQPAPPPVPPAQTAPPQNPPQAPGQVIPLQQAPPPQTSP